MRALVLFMAFAFSHAFAQHDPLRGPAPVDEVGKAAPMANAENADK